MPIHPNYILSILGMLSDYYNTEPTEAQLRIYIDHLSDLEPWALKEAAYRWIERSPFYPKVSEILQTASNIPQPQPDYLFAEVLALEDDFYHRGILDPEAYHDLAARCESADRLHTAEHVRQRLALFQSMLEEEREGT